MKNIQQTLPALKGPTCWFSFADCSPNNLDIGDSEYDMYTSELSPEYIDFNRSEYAYWKQSRKDELI